jgi:YVTN family beta-propeller protein
MVKATDESVLYASCPGTNTVIVIDPDPDSFTVLYTIDVGTNPYGLDVTPDNAWVYVANTDDDTVSVISTATNTVVKTIGE